MAGRLTLTVVKARNLKAMDITGKSGAQGPIRDTFFRNTAIYKIIKYPINFIIYLQIYKEINKTR